MIAIQLILFSLILSFIIFMSGVSRDLLSITNDKTAIKEQLTVYRDVSFYDNNEVTADDVLIAVQKYTKVYDITILINDFPFELKVEDPHSEWSLDNVRFHMQGGMSRKYIANIVWESDIVKGIIFDDVN